MKLFYYWFLEYPFRDIKKTSVWQVVPYWKAAGVLRVWPFWPADGFTSANNILSECFCIFFPLFFFLFLRLLPRHWNISFVSRLSDCIGCSTALVRKVHKIFASKLFFFIYLFFYHKSRTVWRQISPTNKGAVPFNDAEIQKKKCFTFFSSFLQSIV